MRSLLVAALIVGITSAAAVPTYAADEPAEAQAGVEAIRSVLRAPKNAKFRKVKVTAAGDVCATVEDTEVLWTKASGRIWIHEAETAQETILGMTGPNIVRSDERADFLAWRTCQKG